MLSSPLKLILASQSPQRKSLLTEAGYAFEVVPPSDTAEDGIGSGESPADLVMRLAMQKACDVASRTEHGIILGCDTLAECEGQVLGKPVDQQHAREMLMLLRGQEHQVLSGLALWQRPGDKKIVRLATTRLLMEEIKEKEIKAYLESGQWKGKAGAFGLQDRLGWIRVIDGSKSNVIGLPLELLAEMLEEIT